MNKIKVRKANNKDIYDIYNWRNDPITKKMSKNKSSINLDEHKDWFNKKKRDENTLILMCIEKHFNKKIGVVFFNLNERNKSSNISINLDPLNRNKGYGSECLSISINFFKKYFENCDKIFAEIKNDNISSIKTFEKIGFIKIKENKNMMLFKLSTK